MKTFVTGGNGFLGSWLIKELVKKGHQVFLLHRPTSDLSNLKDIPYESRVGDITDYSSVKAGMQGCQYVFHVAAHIAYSPQARTQMNRINVGGTENVLRACIENKVQRMVHTSSVAAIGASADPEILNEDSPYEIGNFNIGYNETKRAAEELVRSAVRSGKLDAVIVNPSIIFGPGDVQKDSRQLYLKVTKGKVPFYPPGGVNVTYVADVVEGHIKALEKGRVGERYILGGQNLSLKSLFALLAKKGKHRAPIIPMPAVLLNSAFNTEKFLRRFGVELGMNSESLFLSTLYHWYDNSRAKIELGINFHSAEFAISESIKWSQANGYLD